MLFAVAVAHDVEPAGAVGRRCRICRHPRRLARARRRSRPARSASACVTATSTGTFEALDERGLLAAAARGWRARGHRRRRRLPACRDPRRSTPDGGPTRRTRIRAARRRRRDRHEPRALRSRRAAPQNLADGRLRRLVRRRRSARRRSHHAGHRLPRGAAQESRRHRADPRARGSFRRAVRSVAAPWRAGLCDAVHGGADRGEARVRAGRAEDRHPCRAARQPFQRRPVRHRIRHGRAFDSGIERADHPHAARHRAAYRRLEDRSDPADRPADRRGQAARARRRGLPRHDRRFHQRRARGPLAVGSRRCEDAGAADPASRRNASR